MLLPYIKRNVVSLGPDDLIAALSTPGKPAPLERLSPSGARLVAELKPGPCVLRLADGGGRRRRRVGWWWRGIGARPERVRAYFRRLLHCLAAQPVCDSSAAHVSMTLMLLPAMVVAMLPSQRQFSILLTQESCFRSSVYEMLGVFVCVQA